MYKIDYFDRKFPDGNAQGCDNADAYSIWRLCPWRRWHTLTLEFLSPAAATSPCRPEWFPLMYWLALTISVCGFVSTNIQVRLILRMTVGGLQFFSCSEFLSIYYGSWTLSTFRDRKFRVIPLVFRRNVRLISAAFMTKTCASLVIGIVSVTPSAITSWLTIYFAVFCLELIPWIGEILFGVIKLDARSVWSHCVSFGTYLVIRCVRDVFRRVIERQGSIHELELMPALLSR